VSVEQVWVYHAGLGAYAEVPKTSLGQHARAGWVLVPEPEPEPQPEFEDEETVDLAEEN